MRNAHSASNLRATPRVLFIKHNEEGRVVALISQDAGCQSRTQNKRKSYSRARCSAQSRCISIPQATLPCWPSGTSP